jgi:hypothetical protein
MATAIANRIAQAPQLRKYLFFAALALSALIVLIEIGAVGVLSGATGGLSNVGEVLPDDPEVRAAFDDLDDEQRAELEGLAGQDKPPGIGIPYMALLDGIILFTVALIALSNVISYRIHGRVQGIATFIFALIIIITGIVMAVVALALVLLMVGLLLAVPFGTLAYLARYGFFNTGGAAGALALLMTLKILFAACLVATNPRYLQNKGLVLLITTSLVANIILAFLHGFVPRFLVSITDGIGAIVVAILAIIWAVILLVGSIPSVLRALNVARA